MRPILEELKNGNKSIADYFVLANKKWEEILYDLDEISIEDLAKRLSKYQESFHTICEDDRLLGKSLMACSGFTHLYSSDIGFGEKGNLAFKLIKAFESSYCSSEIISWAKTAAQLYNVKEYSNENM